MSQTEQIFEQRQILKVERAIRLQMETLIPKMQKIADDYDIAGAKSPYRNVLSVAVDPASDVEVTKNFIRYQLGRDQKSPWRKTGNGSKKLGLVLVDVISGLGDSAKQVLEAIGGDSNTELGKRQLQEVHRRLMQLYLGNFVRYQVYLTFREDERKSQERKSRNV